MVSIEEVPDDYSPNQAAPPPVQPSVLRMSTASNHSAVINTIGPKKQLYELMDLHYSNAVGRSKVRYLEKNYEYYRSQIGNRNGYCRAAVVQLLEHFVRRTTPVTELEEFIRKIVVLGNESYNILIAHLKSIVELLKQQQNHKAMQFLQDRLQNIAFDNALTDFTRNMTFGYLTGTEIQNTDLGMLVTDESTVAEFQRQILEEKAELGDELMLTLLAKGLGIQIVEIDLNEEREIDANSDPKNRYNIDTPNIPTAHILRTATSHMILYPSEYSVIDGYDESVPGHYKQVHLSPEIENLTKSYPFKSSVANNVDKQAFQSFDDLAIEFILESMVHCKGIKDFIVGQISPDEIPPIYRETYNSAIRQYEELVRIEREIDRSLLNKTLANEPKAEDFISQPMPRSLCPNCQRAEANIILSSKCAYCQPCLQYLVDQFTQQDGGMIYPHFYETAVCYYGHKFTRDDLKKILGQHKFALRSGIK